MSPGGRLDRALQVVEQVARSVRLTLVVDPRLLDAEREMRLINMRKEKSSKSGLLSKLLSRK